MQNSFSHRKRKSVDVSAWQARKRKGDVSNTPPILTANAPSSYGLCKDIDVSQGPPQKRKGDVMRIHGVINTPSILGENAPSSSRQGTHVVCPLDFIIELVLQTSFSWPFPSYMLKFDISL
jgi:hypothetical protein